MKHPKVTMGILMALAVVGVMGGLVTEGPRPSTLLLALGIVFGGIAWVGILRQAPQTPKPWARWQTVVSVAVLAPVAAVTLGTLAWTAINHSDPVLRVAAVVSLVLIPWWLVQFVRMALRQHRSALLAEPGH